MGDGESRTSQKALKEFLAEAEDILERFHSDLLVLGGLAEGAAIPPERLNNIFRCAHSLKGISGLFGYPRVSSVAHSLESLLDSLRLGKLTLAPGILDLLFEGVEAIGNLLRTEDGDGIDLEALDRLKVRIGDAKAQERTEDTQVFLKAYDLGENILSVLTEYEEYRLVENLRRGNRLYIVHSVYDLSTFDQDLVKYLEELKTQGEVITPLPNSSSGSPNALAFDILFATRKDWKDLAPLFERDPVHVTEVKKKARPAEGEAARVAGPAWSGDGLEAPGADRRPPALSPGVSAPAASIPPTSPLEVGDSAEGRPSVEPLPDKANGPSPAADKSTARSLTRTVKVDVDQLDAIIDVVGALILSKTEIGIIADRWQAGEVGEAEIRALLWRAEQNLDKRLTALQLTAVDMRMVPLQELFQRLSGIVRKLSRQMEKETEFKARGGDTRLDKLIREEIADPLMHIIRNSLDHGIEPTEERIRLGKPAAGTIELSASQVGNFVLIEVVDDGKGIDLEEVYRTAVEKGLIQRDEVLGRRELLDLLFAPGFTTKKEVSEISGRGVGMDVVRKNISALKGTVHIEGEPAKGTRVTILLPMTLAMIKAQIVREGGRTYAIPVSSTRWDYQVRPDEILTVEGKRAFVFEGRTVPLVRLGPILGWQEVPRTTDIRDVVVVSVAQHVVGIPVDEIVDLQVIVIKDVGPSLRGIRGIAGAADLGTGETILVLDPLGLIEAAGAGDPGRPVSAREGAA